MIIHEKSYETHQWILKKSARLFMVDEWLRHNLNLNGIMNEII